MILHNAAMFDSEQAKTIHELKVGGHEHPIVKKVRTASIAE
jgi:hypothetical protein